ncbi:CYTH and CHAD domain-containing protein [Corynebacterium sp. TAE3-ERU12]|uniref:CYTH and CHAD domain-containing protein n=1 Tax=Corynebacterium sp. TAE3-ERU12 TaxID=2849491 RepID=UPI001C451949|nr:CYTH and CHAD domain-containing protein [Corynebacterium sp. TAE3-ERU12]MBV7295814.1 CYTH and CHAD domain-containing protein [Corynebacterium sp. TAE3-ERU12]
MSTTQSLEIEAKFSVADDITVPTLTALAEVVSADEPEIIELSAVYYDTEDLVLTRAKRTLRRRTGGSDEGWHLKTPAGKGRMELGAPLGNPDDPAPAEVLGPVRAMVRNHRLDPIAEVNNSRHIYLLRDASGAVIAEFCDDHVTARSLLPGGQETSWREWELELVGDIAGTERGEMMLTHAHDVFLGAGASDEASPSKLAAALGDSVDNVPQPQSPTPPPKGTAARTVVDALAANRDKLLETDPLVRRDEWDSVHQMRVATRELRSHLQTFHGILGGQRLELVEHELKALAGILGVARDAEVVAERFENLMTREEAEGIDPSIREALAADMRREYTRAHRHVIAALDSDRYLNLLDELDALLADPPVLEHPGEAEEDATPAEQPEEEAEQPEAEAEPKEKKAHQPVKTEDTAAVLAKHLAQAYRKLMKRHKKAMSDWGNTELSRQDREERFHDVRKAAKKLRYSAEAAGGAGLKTKSLYKACKEMQSSLGDFQDTVTAREVLLRKARRAHRLGQDTFGYGVLYQIEYADGLAALSDYKERMKGIEKAYRKLEKKL